MSTRHYGGQGDTSDGVGYVVVPDPSRPGQTMLADPGLPLIVQDMGNLAEIDASAMDGAVTGQFGTARFAITYDVGDPPPFVRVSVDNVNWTTLMAWELWVAVSELAAAPSGSNVKFVGRAGKTSLKFFDGATQPTTGLDPTAVNLWVVT